ncbi:hypothetical protein JX266_006884 [Neoarthrinium moseri]|nr:hypothetical protein JX266_006884 [Neoarthrinium moseri]
MRFQAPLLLNLAAIVSAALTATEIESICVPQGAGSCQGVYVCTDKGPERTTECVFHVFDSRCDALSPEDPWPGVRAGDQLNYKGLREPIVIQKVIEALDKNTLQVVYRYGEGWYGQDKSQYVKGDCSERGSECVFFRAAFYCGMGVDP